MGIIVSDQVGTDTEDPAVEPSTLKINETLSNRVVFSGKINPFISINAINLVPDLFRVGTNVEVKGSTSSDNLKTDSMKEELKIFLLVLVLT